MWRDAGTTPASADSAVPQPAVPQPAVPQPAVPQPAVPQPAVPQPAVPQPAVPQPAVPQPAVPQPAVPQPAVPQPAVPQPAVPQPAVPVSGVELSAEPSPEWLELWWQVDGRGGGAELATARTILTGCPSIYALVRSDDGVAAAVGRLALPPGRPGGRGEVLGGEAARWGGLYGMATRPDARRRGYARQIMQALLNEGTARRLAGYWLLVTAANQGAQQLYAGAGFSEAGRYLYRQDRLKRHLTGC
ncbi:GNAT family N-acetyltransferase [Pseudarthrobacter sp. BIM B-2242]|nr:GNAT family N-acetyltransferase [Pseudarthrobacter sp. BIM B-2242]